MENGDPREGWERVAALCGHARSERAQPETREAAQSALSCLGPVERIAFLGRVVKQTPALEQQMGKTASEIDGLVTRAKNKLNGADPDLPPAA